MAISRKHKTFRLFLAVFWTAVLSWMWLSMQARGVDERLLTSDGQVEVLESAEGLRFLPRGPSKRVGLIFYPGALVEPDAYAPLAHEVAEAGYPVFLVKLPYRLAPRAAHEAEVVRRTDDVLASHPEVRSWVLGGHSRGGALAARIAPTRQERLTGLLLIGTSHPREHDLSGLPLDVTKIFASEDGLASEAEVKEFARLLPPSTHFVRVEGGNHAQFGWYGRQLGDSSAKIPRDEQHRQTVAAVLEALRRVAPAS
ncbi:MAG TPA: alpha/beta hydrolase [Thermoanaerobaculia bacterium]|nr:alpha/beta hydrolase [Thermoanaerobaculia bacterium]